MRCLLRRQTLIRFPPSSSTKPPSRCQFNSTFNYIHSTFENPEAAADEAQTMAFWCRVKQSQSRLYPLHQIRRIHFQTTALIQSPHPRNSNLDRVFLGSVFGIVPDWRISRRPNEFCDNARFFAAPFQPKPKEEKDKMGPRLNDKITGDVVRLVISDEEHVIVSLKEAFQRAQRLGMDLVEVNRKAEPPVVKIMDFHKEKYEKKLKEKEISKTKTKLKTSECKEIRLTPKIEQKDLEMKAKNALRSMESGYRVKCTVSGKESENVGGTLARLCALFEDAAIVESGPRVDRKQAYIVIRHSKFGPSKSGGGKKVSQISVDAFTSLDPVMGEDTESSVQESNQNADKSTSSESGVSESHSQKPTPPPPPPRLPQPPFVSEDRYKKNNVSNKFPQTNPAAGIRPPYKPNGFPSVMRSELNDSQVRSPWQSSPKEVPRQQQQQQTIRAPPTDDGIRESERKLQSDRRPTTNPSERIPMPEKTFGIFSKR